MAKKQKNKDKQVVIKKQKMQQEYEQVNLDYKKIPVQIKRQDFIFKITEETLQRINLPLQQIVSIINKEGKTFDRINYINDQQIKEKKSNCQILYMCLHKVNKNVCSFSKMPFVKELAHVQFVNTIYLNLSSCQLYGLEDLQFINAPVLQTLQLFNNKIGNIKGILKNQRMRNLASLSLYKNPILQMSKLFQGRFPKLYYFQLNISTNQNQFSSIEDLFFSVKLQSKCQIQSSISLWANNTIQKENVSHFKANISFVV